MVTVYGWQKCLQERESPSSAAIESLSKWFQEDNEDQDVARRIVWDYFDRVKHAMGTHVRLLFESSNDDESPPGYYPTHMLFRK